METDNIVLEHLRAIRRDLAKLSDEVRGLRDEKIALRLHVSGLGVTQEQDHADIAQLKDRVDRIETRLGLID
jgi:hypothetical protein